MSTLFRRKQLTPAKRICLRLKEQRLKKGVSLTKLSKQTKISKKHLVALEKCHFDRLPEGEIYQKNFIKQYLKALDTEAEPFLDQFIKEEATYSKKVEKKHPGKHLSLSQFSDLPNLIRIIIVLLIIFLFIGYLGVQVKNILEPPRLNLFSPQNGSISDTTSVVVKGETEKGMAVSINGKAVKINEDGQFEEVVDLNPGLNTITVTVKKKHGKTTEETRHVILRE